MVVSNMNFKLNLIHINILIHNLIITRFSDIVNV